jgi:hypothetical protein
MGSGRERAGNRVGTAKQSREMPFRPIPGSISVPSRRLLEAEIEAVMAAGLWDVNETQTPCLRSLQILRASYVEPLDRHGLASALTTWLRRTPDDARAEVCLRLLGATRITRNLLLGQRQAEAGKVELHGSLVSADAVRRRPAGRQWLAISWLADELNVSERRHHKSPFPKPFISGLEVISVQQEIEVAVSPGVHTLRTELHLRSVDEEPILVSVAGLGPPQNIAGALTYSKSDLTAGGELLHYFEPPRLIDHNDLYLSWDEVFHDSGCIAANETRANPYYYLEWVAGKLTESIAFRISTKTDPICSMAHATMKFADEKAHEETVAHIFKNGTNYFYDWVRPPTGAVCRLFGYLPV